MTVNLKNKTKIIRDIKVDLDKCTGCRSCEVACSAFHAVPRYSSINPARSRIRVVLDEITDEYVPIRAGGYTQAECIGRNIYQINGKEYSECSFCPASCPSRDLFKEPDSGLPLKCDMCENDPPLDTPMCVQACKFDALIYEEREEKIADEVEANEPGEMDQAIGLLIKKHGKKRIMDTFNRLTGRYNNWKQ